MGCFAGQSQQWCAAGLSSTKGHPHRVHSTKQAGGKMSMSNASAVACAAYLVRTLFDSIEQVQGRIPPDFVSPPRRQ